MGYVELANMHEDTNTIMPYMMENNEKIYLRSNDIMFSNSRCLFIEYNDIIKSPWFMLLLTMSRIPSQFSKYFNVDRLMGLDSTGLSEWYIHRKNQNPLSDLVKPEFRNKITINYLDDMVNPIITENPDLIKLSPILNVGKTLQALPYGKDSIIKKVVVWSQYDNEEIKKDLYDTFGQDINYATGNIETVLKTIPDDSTYIFSDITNISILYDINKLKYSSVIVPEEYWYNSVDDTLKINLDAYKDACDFIYTSIYASIKPID